MSRRRLLVGTSLVLVLQGCYTYTPIDVADLQPDMEVRAEITPAERDALADVLPGDDRSLDGTVISTNDTGVMLQVTAVTTQQGIRMESLDQRVEVDRAGLLEVQVKERDSARSAGLIALVTAGVIALVVIALDSGGAEDPGNIGPPPPQDAVIPLVRIPLGR